MTRRIWAGTLIGALSWIVGSGLTTMMAGGLSASSGYAVVVGWWLTAYVSGKCRIQWFSAVQLFAIYWVACVGASIAGSDWFYRDVSSLTLAWLLVVASMQVALVASPVVFDGVVRVLLERHDRAVGMSGPSAP